MYDSFDVDAALTAMSAEKLRELVRDLLLEIDDRAHGRILDLVIERAARSNSGWAPDGPSADSISSILNFAKAAERVGYAPVVLPGATGIVCGHLEDRCKLLDLQLDFIKRCVDACALKELPGGVNIKLGSLDWITIALNHPCARDRIDCDQHARTIIWCDVNGERVPIVAGRFHDEIDLIIRRFVFIGPEPAVRRELLVLVPDDYIGWPGAVSDLLHREAIQHDNRHRPRDNNRDDPHTMS